MRSTKPNIRTFLNKQRMCHVQIDSQNVLYVVCIILIFVSELSQTDSPYMKFIMI